MSEVENHGRAREGAPDIDRWLANSIVLIGVIKYAYSPKGFPNPSHGFLKNSRSFCLLVPSFAPPDKSIMSLEKSRDCSVLDSGCA